MDIRTTLLDIENIQSIIQFIDEYKHDSELNTDTFILDFQQKHVFSFIEKLVYDIAKLQLDIRNETLDETTDNIEFWWRGDANINFFHIDCDETHRKKYKEYKTPYLSNVLYLNQTNIPTIILPIDVQSYMYKRFDISEVFLSFPAIGKLISFHDPYIHACFSVDKENMTKRQCLMVNIWKKYKPMNTKTFNLSDQHKNISCNINNITPINNQPSKQNLNPIKMSKNDINEVLYNHEYKSLTSLKPFIEKSIIGEDIRINVTQECVKRKDFKNKFHIIPSIYQDDECEWLLKSNVMNETILSYIQHTTDSRVLSKIKHDFPGIKEVQLREVFRNYHHTEYDLCIIICIEDIRIKLDGNESILKKGDVLYYFHTIFQKKVTVQENCQKSYICLIFKVFND